jgi:hypothetical protein
MSWRRIAFCMVLPAAATSGCSLERTAVRITASVAKRGSLALAGEGDVVLARAAAPGQIKTAEGMLETLPNNPDLLEILANGYLQFAFGFLEDDLESSHDEVERQVLGARATEFYDRALGFALRGLTTHDAHFTQAFQRGGTALDRAVGQLDRAAVAPLTYAGAALASSINLNRGDPSRLVDLPKVVQLLTRADALERRFGGGLAAMVLGIIYGQDPALGGQPAKSRAWFEASIAATGGKYLMSRVMFARAYAVAVRDRTLFRTTLEAILAVPTKDLPLEYRLANEMAKRRAARYLERSDELFASAARGRSPAGSYPRSISATACCQAAMPRPMARKYSRAASSSERSASAAACRWYTRSRYASK